MLIRYLKTQRTKKECTKLKVERKQKEKKKRQKENKLHTLFPEEQPTSIDQGNALIAKRRVQEKKMARGGKRSKSVSTK